MSRFVPEANLPGTCSALIYGAKYAEKIRKSLDFLNIESILLPDNPDIDPRVAGHADLSVLHAGGEKLFLAPYLKGNALADRMQTRGALLHYPKLRQGHDYPADAQLNLCVLGQNVICNPKTAAAEIVDYLTNKCMKRCIPVRQGYSRCAVCAADADSIITADEGIAAAAEENGLHTLLIRPGYILLDGYPYGFIGGASFKTAPDKLAFTGRIDAHPDCERILSFLSERGIEPVYLTREPVFDIGSAVPIIEN